MPFALLQDDAEVVSNESAITAVPNDRAKSCLGRVELTGRQSRNAFGKARGQRWREILDTSPGKR